MYDDKTELLTSNGWKLIKEVTEEDSIAMIKNNTIIYDEAKMKSENFEGTMNNIVSSSFDIAFTPDTKVSVIANRKGEDNVYHLTCREIYNETNVSIQHTANYKNVVNFKGEKTIGHDKASFIATILCIGIIENNKLILNPSAEFPDEINYTVNLLDSLKINYEIKKGEIEIVTNGESYIIPDFRIHINEDIKWIYRYVDNNLNPKYKLLHMVVNELDIMFATINFFSSEIDIDKIHFITNKKELLEWYRVLCIHLGLKTKLFVKKSFYIGNNVVVTRDKNTPIYKQNREKYFKTFEYSGIVYGIKTKFNIIIRRNKKICIGSAN